MKRKSQKKTNSGITKIPTTRFSTETGIFFNQAYSVPLGLYEEKDPTLGNTLRVLSFFNKKCYIYDLNRSGVNFNRSIPFNIDFLTGNPSKDKFYFDPARRLLSLRKISRTDPNNQFEDQLRFEEEEQDPEFTARPKLQKIKFDSQLTKIVSSEIIPGELAFFYDQGTEILKQKLNLGKPTLFRPKRLDEENTKSPVYLELLTDLLDSSRSEGRPIMRLPLREVKYIDPAFRSVSFVVLDQGLQTMMHKPHSHMRIIGVHSSKTSLMMIDGRNKRVLKTITIEKENALYELTLSCRYGPFMRAGGLAYDLKNDVLLGYEPHEMFYSVGEASKGGASKHKRTQFHQGAKADRKFRELIKKTREFDSWFIHHQLKRIILEAKFGRGATNLIQINQKSTLLIDGASFRLLEKEMENYKEIWSHQFNLALKPNFIKASRKVIASLSPCAKELCLYELKNEKISILKTIKVLDLVKDLPRSVTKGELISFEMPVKKTKTRSPSKGHFCLSYGDTIIKAELSKNIEPVNITSLHDCPYILAAKSSKGGGYVLLTEKDLNNYGYFKFLDSKLKIKSESMKVRTGRYWGNTNKMVVGHSHIFIKISGMSKCQYLRSRPRLRRESKYKEEPTVSYLIFKGTASRKLNFLKSVHEEPQNCFVASSLTEKNGFIVQEKGDNPEEIYLSVYSNSTTPKVIKFSDNGKQLNGGLIDLFSIGSEFCILQTQGGIFWLLSGKRKNKKPLSRLEFEGDYQPIDFLDLTKNQFLDFDEKNDSIVMMDFSSVISGKNSSIRRR